MNVLVLLLCGATLVAGNKNSLDDFGGQQEQYLIDIENFNGEGSSLDHILQQFDPQDGNLHETNII